MNNFESKITKKIKEQQLGGIDISCLDIGTQIEVTTHNSIYKIELLGDKNIKIHGGKIFPENTEAYFNGSTWGGTLLKLNWIGKGMRMEIIHNNKTILTSSTKKAKVITKDWFYELWN